jgi:molybdate transport system ATP-binding protein
MNSDQLAVDVELPLGRFSLDVSVHTHKHMTGLFGRSGSGKTSFLEVVAGLRRNAAGTVKLGDVIWQDSARGIFLPPENRGVGYVPQEGLLFPHLTVQQNLCFGRRSSHGNGNGHAKTLSNVIELLELETLLEQNVRTLSGGERQRVSLGRALCSGPKILLLDEPLAALDQALRRKILPFIRRIRDEFDIPMMLVSHDTLEVQALCDDLLVLDDGAVIARGAPREVLVDSVVLSVEGGHGLENIIPCATERSSDGLTIVRLGDPATEVKLSLFSEAEIERKSRYVGIPAQDIILATTKPEGLSARNIIPGTIEQIQGLTNFRLISVSLGTGIPPLVVELTKDACEKLSLVKGLGVYLVIKSMACTLYEGRSTVPQNRNNPAD